jgi:hypothetical protein
MWGAFVDLMHSPIALFLGAMAILLLSVKGLDRLLGFLINFDRFKEH